MSRKVKILDVEIDPVSLPEAELKIASFLDESKTNRIVCTVNTEFIVQAQKNQTFKKILNHQSSLNLADGIGVLWAARFFSLHAPNFPVLRELIILAQWLLVIVLIPIYPRFFKKSIPEKISGADFAKVIASEAQQRKKTIFLLGGAPTIAERAALSLQTDFVNLRIAGVDSSRAEDEEKIINTINKSQADILFVAFGCPKQEIWISKNFPKTCCQLAIGLGGTFDFLAGVKKRSPLWIQKIGLEWLFRLITEPKRIVRQLSIPYFMYLVLLQRLKDAQRD